MSKLPVISGKDCVKSFNKVGFTFKHQTGSHMVLKNQSSNLMVVIPDHKELDRGTLRAIIRQAGLSLDQFVNLLK